MRRVALSTGRVTLPVAPLDKSSAGMQLWKEMSGLEKSSSETEKVGQCDVHSRRVCFGHDDRVSILVDVVIETEESGDTMNDHAFV